MHINKIFNSGHYFTYLLAVYQHSVVTVTHLQPISYKAQNYFKLFFNMLSNIKLYLFLCDPLEFSKIQ